MSGKYLAGILLLCFSSWSTGQESPCPDVFHYQRQSNGDVYGVISLPYDGSTELHLGINASMKGYYTDNKTVKLKIKMITPGQDIIGQKTNSLTYDLYFPFKNVIPKITRITYNNREFCIGPPEELVPGSPGVTSLWAGHNYFFNAPNEIQPTIQSPSNQTDVTQEIDQNERNQVVNYPALPTFNTRNVNELCGIARNSPIPLIVGGKEVSDGAFPWLAAMFTATGGGYQYKCTGNLVSNRHVVTAARCVNFFKLQVVQTDDILLVFGTNDLKHWATSRAVTRCASAVRANLEFDVNSGHGDIAVITLDRPVEFSSTIAPICLWEGDGVLDAVVNKMGTVAGWGLDKPDQLSKTYSSSSAKFIDMPIVSQGDCLFSNLTYYKLTSDLTFCAGSRDGTGICIGDSGAGFFLKRNGRWYLRGLASIILNNQDSCDLNNFMVFSDAAKLAGWVKKTIAV